MAEDFAAQTHILGLRRFQAWELYPLLDSCSDFAFNDPDAEGRH